MRAAAMKLTLWNRVLRVAVPSLRFCSAIPFLPKPSSSVQDHRLFQADIIDLKIELARGGAAYEQYGHDIMAVSAVECGERNACLLPFGARCERLLSGNLASADREDEDAIGVAVSFGEEDDALSRG